MRRPIVLACVLLLLGSGLAMSAARGESVRTNATSPFVAGPWTIHAPTPV